MKRTIVGGTTTATDTPEQYHRTTTHECDPIHRLLLVCWLGFLVQDMALTPLIDTALHTASLDSLHTYMYMSTAKSASCISHQHPSIQAGCLSLYRVMGMCSLHHGGPDLPIGQRPDPISQAIGEIARHEKGNLTCFM
jgi:hypothetical protein